MVKLRHLEEESKYNIMKRRHVYPIAYDKDHYVVCVGLFSIIQLYFLENICSCVSLFFIIVLLVENIFNPKWKDL